MSSYLFIKKKSHIKNILMTISNLLIYDGQLYEMQKKTQSVSEKYEKSKNGWLMLKSKRSTCGSKKTKFVKRGGGLL